MRSHAAVLVVAGLAGTSAAAADVPAAFHAEPACAAQSAPTLGIELSKPQGRMPVRGMDHFVAIYGKSTASSDDAASDAGDQAPALARTDTSSS